MLVIIEVLSWKSKINYVTINPGDVMEEIWKEIPGYENYQMFMILYQMLLKVLMEIVHS